MSFKSSKNENVVCCNFQVTPGCTYNGEMTMLLSNPPAGHSLVNNEGAYLAAPYTIGAISGLTQIKLNTDGIYSINVKVNNDFVGTATPTVFYIKIYALPPTGGWIVVGASETICPIWTTDSSIIGSCVFDTRVVNSKTICINVFSQQTLITASGGYWQGVSVSRISL